MQKHTWSDTKVKIEELAFNLRDKAEDSGFTLDRRQVVAIALLLVLTVVGSLVFYIASRPKPVVVERASADTVEMQSTPKAQPKPEGPPKLYVHVAGAVAKPGVYQLSRGSRVIDAIEKAGGPVQGADGNALNLAAKLCDGQRVFVPKQGEALPQGDALGASAGPTPATGGKVNLNTATMEQLDALPGVGEVTAKRIIDYRTKRGSFTRISELKEVEGIGPKKYEQLKDVVSVD